MKKIIIFTSAGGGGHQTVTQALCSLLEKEYNVQSNLIFTDILSPIDPAQNIFTSKKNGENLYNYLMQKKQFTALNIMSKLGFWYYKIRNRSVKKLLINYLVQEKPDLIISVIPFINNQILSVAETLDIPFLLIPTDLDVTTFIADIKNLTYKKFISTVIFSDPLIKNITTKAQLPNNQIIPVGLPLRHDFYIPKNLDAIKQFWDIPNNKHVILLLMGAAGSQGIKKFTKALFNVKKPIHIIICIGKKNELEIDIAKFIIPEHISYTIVPYTQKVADLIAIADLVITKSGSVSVYEAVHIGIPLLLDATSPLLKWEKLNHNFIQQNGFGLSIDNLFDLSAQVDTLFAQNNNQLNSMKKQLLQFNKPVTQQIIPQLVHTLINL